MKYKDQSKIFCMRGAAFCLLACMLIGLSACDDALLAMGEPVDLSGLTIVIDAGHGDTDVGTIGAQTGIYEKDINFEIAVLLAEALKEKDAHVVMTRDSDKPLGDPQEQDLSARKEADMLAREQIIETAEANLLISIHQNQFDDASVYGPQVFFLRYEDGKEEGVEFAKAIQKALNEQLAVQKPREVGAGNWRLLKKGEQPGCIVECGFLSNAEEELLLQDPAYQARIVEAIVMGVEAYVSQYGV